MFMVLSLILSIFWISTGVADVKFKIVNGTETQYGQFPSTVALLNAYDLLICTGSLITNQIIFSAGHCFTIGEPKMVMAGDIYLQVQNENQHMSRKTREIQKIVVHPEFLANNTFTNDLGIALVKRPFKFSAFIKSIELCGRLPQLDDICYSVGWGATKLERKDQQSDILLYQETRVVHSKNCILESKKIPDNICVFSNKSVAYFGDSGGPLICEDKLCGVLSGYTNNTHKYTNIHVKLFEFNEWIQKTIEDLNKYNLKKKPTGQQRNSPINFSRKLRSKSTKTKRIFFELTFLGVLLLKFI